MKKDLLLRAARVVRTEKGDEGLKKLKLAIKDRLASLLRQRKPA